MELYKLLSCTEYQRDHKLIKEWKVRIQQKLIYAISVEYSQDRTSIVVLLNDCVIEKRIRQRLQLPIIINGIEFIVSLHNQKFTLDVDHQDIEANPARIINMLNEEEFNRLMAESASLILYLGGLQEMQNEEQITLQVESLIIKCRNACKQTTIQNYKASLELQIQQLQESVTELKKRIYHPQPNVEIQKKHAIKIISNDEIKKQHSIKIVQVPQNPQLSQQDQQDQQDQQEDTTCIICMNKLRTHAPFPCGHLKYCEDCIKIVQKNNKCPLCEQAVTSVMKVYK